MKSIAILWASGLALFSPYVLADEIYVAVEGSKLGRFVGESPRKEMVNKAQVIGFEHEIASPRDVATGQASGKRQHRAIKITKRVGASSPQYFIAVTQNEVLKSVTIDFLGTDPKTGFQSIYYQIVLANAGISNIRQYWRPLPNPTALPTAGDHLEDISFTYQTITVKYPPLNGSAMDSWQSQM